MRNPPDAKTDIETFEMKPSQKFACFAFKNIAVHNSLSASLALGTGLWVLPHSPIQLDAQWKKWVGTIKSEKIGESNLFLLAVKDSNTPEILDHENQELLRRVNMLFYGILLQGVPDTVEGWTFTGARIANEITIRSMGDLYNYYHSRPLARIVIGAGTCKTARLFADGYRMIEDSTDYARIKRGMRAVIRGLKEPSAEDRIHEYVRALEALIKPTIGATTKQFVHRSQTIALASRDAKKILEECYLIRNAVEHMHSADDTLASYPKPHRESIAFRRLRQLEGLTFAVYLKLATSNAHAALFKTDSDIESFWLKKDHERCLAWGPGVDLAKIA